MKVRIDAQLSPGLARWLSEHQAVQDPPAALLRYSRNRPSTHPVEHLQGASSVTPGATPLRTRDCASETPTPVARLPSPCRHRYPAQRRRLPA